MYNWIIYYIKSKTNPKTTQRQIFGSTFSKGGKRPTQRPTQRQPKDKSLAPPFLTSYERWIWLPLDLSQRPLSTNTSLETRLIIFSSFSYSLSPLPPMDSIIILFIWSAYLEVLFFQSGCNF